MTQERRKVMGVWHPQVDINAVSFDQEPQAGLAVGDAVADIKRVVSADMGRLIARQEMCFRCLKEYPCSMSSSERFSRFAEALDRSQIRIGGPLTRRLFLDRVLNRCCPYCAIPINDGMLDSQVDFKDVR